MNGNSSGLHGTRRVSNWPRCAANWNPVSARRSPASEIERMRPRLASCSTPGSDLETVDVSDHETSERTEVRSPIASGPVVTPMPSLDDSPEVRIRSLRDSLRNTHSAHSSAQDHRPFYTRLIQTLKYCVPGR